MCAAAWSALARRSTRFWQVMIIPSRSPSCWARRSCSACCSARRSNSRAASSCRPRPTDRFACWWSISPRPTRCAPARASTSNRSRTRSRRAHRMPRALLGRGHLAMTIDQGADMNRYQGLVALDGGTLEDAAHEYFLRSEQIPTRVRLAVAEEFRAASGGASHRWRAGGILLQFVPRAPERARIPDLDPGDAPEGTTPHVVPEDDAWVEGRSLDRDGGGHRTDRSRRCPPSSCSIACSTSAACASSAAPNCGRNAPARARASKPCCVRSRRPTATTWWKNGAISVTCEFCSATYVFEPAEVADRPQPGSGVN